MVSDEENLIDFEASVGKEEEMEKEGGPNVESCASSTSAPAASGCFILQRPKRKIFCHFFLVLKASCRLRHANLRNPATSVCGDLLQ